MADLTAYLRRIIEAEGAVSVARFMAEALGHEDYGYYRTRDPLGRAGDFITAPEVSQMFGELLGLWCASVWESMGGPAPVRLVELGPGRGTLMSDALRSVERNAQKFHGAARIHLVETSPVLRAKQEAALAGRKVSWHDALAGVPAGPVVLLANEFFDALPVHQLVRRDDGWHERQVAIEAGTDRFVLRASPEPSPLSREIPVRLRDAPPDSVVEVGPDRQTLVKEIAQRLVGDGGAALIVDYGHKRSAAGETLQAVKRHRAHDVLNRPGDADLTAHVDFGALGDAARDAGAAVHGPVEQGKFLRSLGIEARRDALLGGATPRQRREIDSGFHRLVDPDQMGSLFKVLSLTRPGLPVPPGFAA